MASESSPPPTTPVQDAREAIWRLFEQGYVDEDMATAGLLAVDLGTRRSRRPEPDGSDWPVARRRAA
jgi:hypothetical protein